MLLIRDVMTRDVFTVTPDTTLRQVADLLTHHHVSGVPVLAGHEVVGVVSSADLLDFIASHEDETSTVELVDDPADDEDARDDGENDPSALYFDDREPEETSSTETPFAMDAEVRSDALNEHTVGEVMTRTVCSLPPDASVAEAARYMWQAGIHRVLVLEGGHLRGIISMSDVARVLAAET